MQSKKLPLTKVAVAALSRIHADSSTAAEKPAPVVHGSTSNLLSSYGLIERGPWSGEWRTTEKGIEQLRLRELIDG